LLITWGHYQNLTLSDLFFDKKANLIMKNLELENKFTNLGVKQNGYITELFKTKMFQNKNVSKQKCFKKAIKF